jgi:predicted TPR repeat methyltransferase
MERGLKEGPKSVDLREYLLLAYLKTGDEDEAIKQMEEIVKEKPKDTDMWLRLAKLQEKVGRYPQAIKAYRQVLELSPGHEEAGEAYLRLRLKGVPGEVRD